MSCILDLVAARDVRAWCRKSKKPEVLKLPRIDSPAAAEDRWLLIEHFVAEAGQHFWGVSS